MAEHGWSSLAKDHLESDARRLEDDNIPLGQRPGPSRSTSRSRQAREANRRRERSPIYRGRAPCVWGDVAQANSRNSSVAMASTVKTGEFTAQSGKPLLLMGAAGRRAPKPSLTSPQRSHPPATGSVRSLQHRARGEPP